MCRWFNQQLQFFIVHPGGPFYKKKDIGAWSIPKGLPNLNEDLLAAAIREFKEETGITPSEPFYKLSPIRQKSGKVVHAWAFFGSWDERQALVSNFFEVEWPPKSGRIQKFPEMDKAEWMTFSKAWECINPAQRDFLIEATKLFERKE